MNTPVKKIPDIYAVRFVRRAEALSCPVVVLLPGDGEPDLSKYDPRSVFIDLTPPDMDPYHIALGRFMNDWGRLEVAMHSFFAELSGLERRRATAVSEQFSGKSLRDLIEKLSAAIHSETEHKTIVKLLERFSKLNTKRNKIVHGLWVIEIFILDGKPNEGSQVRIGTYRQASGIDTQTRDKMDDPDEQKLRTANLFSISAINQVGQLAIALANDFSDAVGKYSSTTEDGLNNASNANTGD